MPASKPILLFHITAIANLPAICRSGALLAKNVSAAEGLAYQNIAHRGAQGARSSKRLPDPPGGVLHDYVPFYFAPRSPMLSAIEHGRVADCYWRQSDIVHIVTSVEKVTAEGKPFVFYDRNATLSYSQPFTDLADLESAVDWEVMTGEPRLGGYAKYWNDTENYPDRKERRQAEFLLQHAVPLAQCLGLGVYNQAKADEVAATLAAAEVTLPVKVKPDWYF